MEFGANRHLVGAVATRKRHLSEDGRTTRATGSGSSGLRRRRDDVTDIRLDLLPAAGQREPDEVAAQPAGRATRWRRSGDPAVVANCFRWRGSCQCVSNNGVNGN